VSVSSGIPKAIATRRRYISCIEPTYGVVRRIRFFGCPLRRPTRTLPCPARLPLGGVSHTPLMSSSRLRRSMSMARRPSCSASRAAQNPPVRMASGSHSQRPTSPAAATALPTIAVSGRLCGGTHFELAPCLPLPFM
jgi:hypothetical protein